MILFFSMVIFMVIIVMIIVIVMVVIVMMIIVVIIMVVIMFIMMFIVMFFLIFLAGVASLILFNVVPFCFLAPGIYQFPLAFSFVSAIVAINKIRTSKLSTHWNYLDYIKIINKYFGGEKQS